MPGLLDLVDVVILNEGEAAELGERALDRPGLAVIVTLGGDGARVHRPGSGDSGGLAVGQHVPAPRVDVVDTTGCGDAFAGALATGLASGADLVAAAAGAVRYAALAATAPGAQNSYVDRATFEAVLAGDQGSVVNGVRRH